MSGTTILTEEVEVISTDGLSSSELAKLFLIPPSRWSEDGVFAWMQHVCDQFDLDTSTLKNLHINGKELQMLSQTEFEKRIPFGNILWAHLQFLITCRTSDNPELTKYGMVNKAVIPSIKRRCNEPHNSAGNCYYLYEFLLALLQDPLTCPHLIRWLDIKLGVFKLMKTKVVSWMWGQHKKKPEMSYETLGRSLRYYSQKGILRKVIGYHLTYQFRFLPKNLKVVPSLEKCSEEQEIQGARDEWPPCLSSRLKAVALNEVFPLSVGTPNLALLYKTVTTANASQNTRHETTQDIRQKVIHVFKLSPQGVVSEVQLSPEPQISRPVKILRLSND
uniref:ETS domain-containing protein n=1 Tax=Ciona savignyi TaxID=51511 RepID=H2ZAP3_CIOSA